MTSLLLNSATAFSVACLFSIALSVLINVYHQFCYRNQHQLYYADRWLLMMAVCVLPFFYTLLPTSTQPLFDINTLPILDHWHAHLTPNTDQLNTNKVPFKGEFLSLTLLLWWMILWINVSFYRIYLSIKGIYQVHSLIAQGLDITDKIDGIAEKHIKLLKNLSRHTKIQVVISPSVLSPCVFSWRQQYLIIPHQLLAELTTEQLRLIIRHELNHLKKHDTLKLLCAQWLSAVMWFNPLIQKFNQHLICAIEIQCDNHVLSHQPHLRRTYAQLMLKVLRKSVTKTSNPMVTAFSILKHRSITMRIDNIMKASDLDVKRKYRKTALYGQAFVLACFTFLAQPQLHAAGNQDHQQWLNPVKEAKVSSKYGAKNKFHKFHSGIDLAAKKNTPIIAVSSGTVRISTDMLENRKNYGTIIIIDHDDGQHSVYYSHLNSRVVEKGQHVEAGQLIGYVGETGKATGPHLHLEVRKNNKHLNPSDYINFD